MPPLSELFEQGWTFQNREEFWARQIAETVGDKKLLAEINKTVEADKTRGYHQEPWPGHIWR